MDSLRLSGPDQQYPERCCFFAYVDLPMCRLAGGFAMLGGEIRNRFKKRHIELCLGFVGDSTMNSASYRVILRVIIPAVTLTAMTATAVAQETTVLEEIVVTSQKREQSLQDVPIAVTVISGDLVRDFLGSAENIRALTNRVPSLNIESSNGRTNPRIYLRGQGNIDFDVNANQPVLMVFDEINLENSALRSLPLFDIERIEVLRGPQGTLYGRNTNAGTIKIDSVLPTFETEGYASVAYGSRDTIAVETAIGGGLSDGVAARLSVKYQTRDNWIDNTANGPGDDFGEFDEFAYRFQLLFQPGDVFRGLVKLHGFHQDGSHPQVFYGNAFEQGQAGLRQGFDEEIAGQDVTLFTDVGDFPQPLGMSLDHFGAAVNLQWDWGDRKFTSISGYDTVESFQSGDIDGAVQTFPPSVPGTPNEVLFAQISTGDGLDEHYQFSQEFRFSNQGDRLFYQVGVFYFDEDIDVRSEDFAGFRPNQTPPHIPTLIPWTDITSQQTTSAAVFGQLEYELSDAWSIIGGVRWTTDDKDLEVIPGPTSPSPADTISIDDDFFNWDLALTWGVSEDWSLYGRAANGSRGPVTLGRFGFTSAAKTETTNSLEFGFKSTLLDGRARWNGAIYGYQNDDQQLTATGGAGNVNQLLNADQVNGAGVETDFEILVTENLFVSTNLSWNDTEIDDPALLQDSCTASPSCTRLDPVVATKPNFFDPGGPDVQIVSIDGNPLPRAPEWIFNFILQYSVPMASGASIYFNTDWNYRDESEIFLYRSVEFVAEDRWLGGLRIGYRNAKENMDFALVGRNITDEITADGALDFNNLVGFVNEPAYWGLEFRYDW